MTTAAAQARIFRDGSPRNAPGNKEIARRYAWHAHRNGKSLRRPEPGKTGYSKFMTLIRLRELERVYSRRWGAVLPDDAAGRNAITITANHIVHAGADAERHILDWIRLWAPWMSASEAGLIAGKAIAAPVKYTADVLGWRLKLNGDERHELGIKTIGAVGVSKADRAAFRKLKAKLRAQGRRRDEGALPRGLYEANSLRRTQPWLELGISRSTWYRAGKPDPNPPAKAPTDAPLNGLSRAPDANGTTAKPAGSTIYIAGNEVVSPCARCGPASRVVRSSASHSALLGSSLAEASVAVERSGAPPPQATQKSPKALQRARERRQRRRWRALRKRKKAEQAAAECDLLEAERMRLDEKWEKEQRSPTLNVE
jgi:hypothetical protein